MNASAPLSRLSRLVQIAAFAWPFLRPQRWQIASAILLSFAAWGLGTFTALVTASGVQVLLSGGNLEAASTRGLVTTGGPPGALDQIARLVLEGIASLSAGRGPGGAILVFSGALILLALLTALANLGTRALWIVIRVTSLRSMQSYVFEQLCRFSMTFYAREKVGDLLASMQRDLADLMTAIQTVLTSLVRAPVMFAIFLVLLFRTNVQLTLITLGVAALTLLGFQLIGRLQRRQASQSYRTFGQFMSIAQEALTSIRVVKAFGAEKFVVEKFRWAASEFARLEAQREILRVHVPDSLSPVLNVVTITVLAAAGSREVAAGRLSQEGLLLFLGVTVLMFASAVTIGNSVVGVYEATAASERVLDLLRNRPEVVDGHLPVPGFRRSLALRHVNFSYGEQFRLRDIQLELREGERLAIVGPSGSGKSTIIDLILRLYDPTAGLVELDGEDIRQYKIESYRRLFGVVSQESLLFNDTIRNNISYGRPELSDEAIREAARIANAHDFIEQMPQGYDTLAGDRGTRLSGGQRQRIAIARALVSRPRILILDEATSSLDSESERQVQQALEAATRNVTTLIVAHRLSTVQMADKIVVLDNGSIAETGTHRTLLASGGLYRHLYEAQMGNGREALAPLATSAS